MSNNKNKVPFVHLSYKQHHLLVLAVEYFKSALTEYQAVPSIHTTGIGELAKLLSPASEKGVRLAIPDYPVLEYTNEAIPQEIMQAHFFTLVSSTLHSTLWRSSLHNCLYVHISCNSDRFAIRQGLMGDLSNPIEELVASMEKAGCAFTLLDLTHVLNRVNIFHSHEQPEPDQVQAFVAKHWPQLAWY